MAGPDVVGLLSQLPIVVTAYSKALLLAVGLRLRQIADAAKWCVTMLRRLVAWLWSSYYRFEGSLSKSGADALMFAWALRFLVGIVLFGGGLVYFRLWWWAAAYVMLLMWAVIQFQRPSQQDVAQETRVHARWRVGLTSLMRYAVRAMVGVVFLGYSWQTGIGTMVWTSVLTGLQRSVSDSVITSRSPSSNSNATLPTGTANADRRSEAPAVDGAEIPSRSPAVVGASTPTSPSAPVDDLSELARIFCPMDGDTVVRVDEGGIDTFIGTVYQQTGTPNGKQLSFGGWGDYYYDLLKFDLSGEPPLQQGWQRRTLLCLFATSVPPNDPQLEVAMVAEQWTPDALSSRMLPNVGTTVPFGRVMEGWNVVDISSIASLWLSGAESNHGIMLLPGANNQTNGAFASGDAEDLSLRPRLIFPQ